MATLAAGLAGGLTGDR
ncbi:hypothetical protein [Yersinia frederiksenii]